jgi:hypothetical protein
VGQRVDLWRLEIHTAIHISFHVKFPVIRFYEGPFSVSSAMICMWIDKEILIDYNRYAYVAENANSESEENAY